MEVWDAYDKDGSLAGSDLVRGEPIPEGLYHIVSEILVQHVSGAFLLMQRDWNKKGYPGMYEATAGGSALKGETPFMAALRELKEETGIISTDLMEINRTQRKPTIYYSYLCITNCNKTSVTLQEGETISYRWVSPHDFLKYMESSACIPTQRERLAPFINRMTKK